MAAAALVSDALLLGRVGPDQIDEAYDFGEAALTAKPAIPNSIAPMLIFPPIWFFVPLVALQAILNLISDWNKEPVSHSADAIDETELEAIKRSVEKN